MSTSPLIPFPPFPPMPPTPQSGGGGGSSDYTFEAPLVNHDGVVSLTIEAPAEGSPNIPNSGQVYTALERARAEMISAASTDATKKADTAEKLAKEYTNEKVEEIVSKISGEEAAREDGDKTNAAAILLKADQVALETEINDRKKADITLQNKLNTHTSATNPHQVTAAQVGVSITDKTIKVGDSALTVLSEETDPVFTEWKDGASVVAGCGATALGDKSIAIGEGALASRDTAVALGVGATATGYGAVAVGPNAYAKSDSLAVVQGPNAIYLGSNVQNVGATARTLQSYFDEKADLVDGTVPASQLPDRYEYGVLEYDTISKFPTEGVRGKIYVDKTTNKIYRWDDTKYVQVSKYYELGEDALTAYPGDKGATNAATIDVHDAKLETLTTLTDQHTGSITDINTKLPLKADLVEGVVPSTQLPAYVDDVLEYASLNVFPKPGERGKIYVALDTNLTYRWGETQYVEISKSLALGETSETAYAGDKGKANADAIAQEIKGRATAITGVRKDLDSEVAARVAADEAHKSDTSNPHKVTAEQTGAVAYPRDQDLTLVSPTTGAERKETTTCIVMWGNDIVGNIQPGSVIRSVTIEATTSQSVSTDRFRLVLWSNDRGDHDSTHNKLLGWSTDLQSLKSGEGLSTTWTFADVVVPSNFKRLIAQLEREDVPIDSIKNFVWGSQNCYTAFAVAYNLNTTGSDQDGSQFLNANRGLSLYKPVVRGSIVYASSAIDLSSYELETGDLTVHGELDADSVVAASVASTTVTAAGNITGVKLYYQAGGTGVYTDVETAIKANANVITKVTDNGYYVTLEY